MYPHETTLYGKPFSWFHDVMGIMEASNLKDAKALAEALRPRIEVYDRSNQDRLLGTLTRRPMDQVRGKMLSMAVMPRMSATYRGTDDYIATMAADRVDFYVSYRVAADGWTMNAFLHTDASLKLLMQLDTFRLPGETHAQYQVRRDYA